MSVYHYFGTVKFLGRANELAALEKAFAGKESAFFPVYGRRRVGKTELILQFLKNKSGVYYLGKQAPAVEQIREFLETAAVAFGEPLLAETRAEGWKKALIRTMARRPKTQKLVLVLDEFQWVVSASPELPSILQEFWDLDWSRSGNVFLILCGSYVGFMEREVLGRKSPLFGRRTGQIKLEPFSYHEAAEFHPSLNRADQARVWFLFGGIPYYLRMFDSQGSTASNIQENFLNPYAPLYREAEFLIREELREVDRYQAILMSLAKGSLRAVDIAQRTGIPSTNIQYYLKSLMELGYLRRRFPLTLHRPPAHAVRYSIWDPVLRFWFRFVFPHASRIVSQPPAQSFDQLIRPELEAYYGGRFEALCRAALPNLYAREKLRESFQVGEYWDRNVQIDLVGLREDERIDLGECRWGTVRSWPALLRELDHRVEAYPNPRNWTVRRWVFTRQPSPRPNDRCRFVSLADLY